MYCSHCGVAASGNFCSGCGTALADAVIQASLVIPLDWSDVVDYDVLLQVPEVRQQIASHAARSSAKLSGEQFLEICDKFISPLTSGVPLMPLAKISQSMSAKLGIKTGKAHKELLPLPAGRTLVRVLCSLAERGQELRTATSAVDGCIVEASLPSDIFALEGELIVTVERTPQGTWVEASTNIPGQAFDWGKSTRCLATLFNDLKQISRAA